MNYSKLYTSVWLGLSFGPAGTVCQVWMCGIGREPRSATDISPRRQGCRAGSCSFLLSSGTGRLCANQIVLSKGRRYIYIYIDIRWGSCVSDVALRFWSWGAVFWFAAAISCACFQARLGLLVYGLICATEAVLVLSNPLINICNPTDNHRRHCQSALMIAAGNTFALWGCA